MNIPIAEMQQRFRLLGLKEPTSLALLPLNFDTASGADELHYAPISKEIESHLKRNGTVVDLLDSTEDRLYVDNRAGDIFLPLLVFARQLISEHPDVIKVTLDLLVNYLSSRFEKLTNRPKVRLRYLRESDNTFELIEYNGPIEGLSEVRKLKSKNDKNNSL